MITYYKGLVATRDFQNTTGSTVSAGTPVELADGRVGIVDSDIDDGQWGSISVSGLFQVPKASAKVIGDGVDVFWDVSGETAILSGDTPAAADIKLGKSYNGAPFGGGTNGDEAVIVDLNVESITQPS